MNRWLLGAATSAAMILVLPGCGSGAGGGRASAASLAVTLRWPARVAAPIPRGTNAVRITIRGARQQIIAGPKVVSKPENPPPGPAKITFNDLPPGPVFVEVTAHGLRDASDEPCSRGFGEGEIVLGQVTTIQVEMASTTYRVGVSPSSLSLAPGQREVLEATAYSFHNTPLLGHTFHWRSDDRLIAEVDPFSGEVRGIAPGQTQIIAQEDFGVMSGAATVIVTGE